MKEQVRNIKGRAKALFYAMKYGGKVADTSDAEMIGIQYEPENLAIVLIPKKKNQPFLLGLTTEKEVQKHDEKGFADFNLTSLEEFKEMNIDERFQYIKECWGLNSSEDDRKLLITVNEMIESVMKEEN